MATTTTTTTTAPHRISRFIEIPVPLSSSPTEVNSSDLLLSHTPETSQLLSSILSEMDAHETRRRLSPHPPRAPTSLPLDTLNPTRTRTSTSSSSSTSTTNTTITNGGSDNSSVLSGPNLKSTGGAMGEKGLHKRYRSWSSANSGNSNTSTGSATGGNAATKADEAGKVTFIPSTNTAPAPNSKLGFMFRKLSRAGQTEEEKEEEQERAQGKGLRNTGEKLRGRFRALTLGVAAGGVK